MYSKTLNDFKVMENAVISEDNTVIAYHWYNRYGALYISFVPERRKKNKTLLNVSFDPKSPIRTI